MNDLSHLSDDDLTKRIARLREIIAQNEMVKVALANLLAERDRRKDGKG